MKFDQSFTPILKVHDEESAWTCLSSTLTDSIRTWDYWVDWAKVVRNAKEFEIDLNTIDYLVGKENVEEELRDLLRLHPTIPRIIPILIASRDSNFKVLTDPEAFVYETFNFTPSNVSLTAAQVDAVVHFCQKTGLLDLYRKKILKSTWDYVLGLEVGLDSNARKNRGGTNMEMLVERLINRMCEGTALQYIPQATQAKVKAKWDVTIPIGKKSPKYDFAVKNGERIYLIETNFYGGGGSKLKSTAGEYRTVAENLRQEGFGFIWITDGEGWKTTLNDLRDTFDDIDYTLNLHFVRLGLLAHIITNKL